MHLYRLDKNIDTKKYLQNLSVDTSGIKILHSKMKLNFIYIKDLNVIGANILKQDALSIGADLATPPETITHKKEFVDAILIANNKQLQTLSKKELAQPFGLKALAKELKKFAKENIFTNKIMGVVNINEDSFYDKSRFVGKRAIQEIQKMIDDGADIIDIGGVSSKPYSKEVSMQEELARVSHIIENIYKEKLYQKAIFSIDTYRSSIASYALERGFSIVNDISSLSDENMANIVAKHDATIVLMHMKGKPINMQDKPSYDDVINQVDTFFANKIQKATDNGIKNIILDIGIGFGKRLEDNINLIKHLSHFKHFGYELLIGASRKSMINDIMKTNIEDRLAGSLTIHQQAISNGANIIRCHDVKEHIQMLKVYESLIN